MKSKTIRSLLFVTVAVALLLALFGFALPGRAAPTLAPSPEAIVRQGWELARLSGAYSYAARSSRPPTPLPGWLTWAAAPAKTASTLRAGPT